MWCEGVGRCEVPGHPENVPVIVTISSHSVGPHVDGSIPDSRRHLLTQDRWIPLRNPVKHLLIADLIVGRWGPSPPVLVPVSTRWDREAPFINVLRVPTITSPPVFRQDIMGAYPDILDPRMSVLYLPRPYNNLSQAIFGRAIYVCTVDN